MASTLEAKLRELLTQKLGQAGPWPAETYRYVTRMARQRGLDELTFLESVTERPDDLTGLVAAATVGHTQFFRHPEHFARLRQAAHGVAQARGAVRVWSAACSSGEEPWSIAMCLHDARVPYEVWASDVNPRAVERARSGRYSARETRNLPEACGKGWTAPPEVRSRVRFVVSALTDKLPAEAPTAFDFVFCRNVFIYLSPSYTQAAWQALLQRTDVAGAVVVAPVESLAGLPSGSNRSTPLGWLERLASTQTRPLSPSPRRVSVPSLKPMPPARPDHDLEQVARLLAADELDTAERVLHGVLAARDDAFGWFLLGEACSRRGESTQARVAFERAAKASSVPSSMDLDTVRAAAVRRARQV